MKRVLFLGEINVDLMMGGLESFPVPDREITCRSFEMTIGSSTAICACNYASLGGNTSFLGLAGEDYFGDFMVNGMVDFGIDTSLVVRTADISTGVTVNLIHDQMRTQVTYPGTIAEFGPEHFKPEDLLGFDHVHTGGLYLQNRLIGAISSLLKFAREHEITTSIDSQWDVSEQWSHLHDWLPDLDFFFCNEDEALSITRSKTPEDACRILSGLTACPVVKIGSQGALFYQNQQVIRIPSTDIEIIDNTGAGDAFDAGFIYARIEKGMDLMEAIRFANGVAARSCLSVGGVNARSSFADVIQFLGKKVDDRD